MKLNDSLPRSSRWLPWTAAIIAAGGLLLTVALRLSQRPRSNSILKSETEQVRHQRTVQAIADLPLSFEPNRGQEDRRVRFAAHRAGFRAFLTSDGAVLAIDQPSLQMPNPRESIDPQRMLRFVSAERLKNTRPDYVSINFEGANSSVLASGEDKLPGTANYLLGSDPAKWQRAIPTYSRVRYHAIYPGIDLVFYGKYGRLEYDLDIAPGADPGIIHMAIGGNRTLALSADGDLILQKSGSARIVLGRPIAYQLANGIRQPVATKYILLNSSEITLAVGQYDRRRPLIIDPAIIYSTYLGGIEAQAQAIAVNSAGEAVVAGWVCCSDDFPVSGGAYQPHLAGTANAFVAKLNASGTSLEFFTYLGGGNTDIATGVGMDSAGNVYVAGMTDSTHFPATATISNNMSQGDFHAFLSSLNPAGTALNYSLYIGASGEDLGTALAVDPSGRAYVVGDTYSTDFPVTRANAYQPNNLSDGQTSTGFLVRIDPPAPGSQDPVEVYGTYLGGSGLNGTTLLQGAAIAGPAGGVYVVGGAGQGFTASTGSPFGGTFDALVASFDTNQSGPASLVFSEFLGGSGFDMATAAATQAGCSNNCPVYIAGYTFSADIPQANDDPYGFQDAFVAKVDAHNGLSGITYEGTQSLEEGLGIGVESNGDPIMAGVTFDAPDLDSSITDSLQGIPAARGALYTSTDGGATFGTITGWPSKAGSITLNGLAADFSVSPPIIYGGTNSQGLWFSIDGGASFNRAGLQGSTGISTQVSAVAVDKLSSTTGPQPVFAAVNHQVEVSGDGGQSFVLRNPLPTPGPANIFFIYADDYPCNVASSSASGNFYILVGTDQGLFQSSDFGEDWTAATGLAGTNQTTQVFSGLRDAYTGDIFVGTDKGVFKSTCDGLTFTPTNLNFAPVISLANTINAVEQGQNFNITSTIYAGTFGDGVIASNDGFNQNLTFGSGLPSSTYNYVAAYVPANITTTNPETETLYVGVGNNLGIGSLWASTDGGNNYSQPSAGTFGPPCCVFPLVAGRGRIYGGNYQEADAMVVELDPTLTVPSIANLGGSSFDEATAVGTDGAGNAYIAGLTYSPDFPLLGAEQSTLGPGGTGLVNGFVTKLGYNSQAQIKVPNTMMFGKHLMRQPGKPLTLVVQNTSKTTAAKLGYIHISGNGAASFQVVKGAPTYTANTPAPTKAKIPTCGPTLAPKSKCGVTIVFTPLAQGLATAGLLVPSNAKNGTQATALYGIGYRRGQH